MKKLTKILMLIGLTTLLFAARDKECTDIGCGGYSGCTANKWVHSSCTITCTDGDMLHCKFNTFN